MKNKHLWTVLFIVLISLSGYAQNQTWKKVSEKEIGSSEKTIRTSIPSAFDIFRLDLKKLTETVQQAPLDISQQKSHVYMDFPTSSGKLERFEIYKTPVLSPILSQKFSKINSYTGKSLSNPTSVIRFSITLFGLEAMHYSAENGTSYIDPYTTDQENYIFYNKKDLKNNKSFVCLAESDNTPVTPVLNLLNNTPFEVSTHTFREYRLAMACTVEYAAFHINRARGANLPMNTIESKKAAVLSAMAATMTRVNFIFERDLAIRMTLIDNNDEIIFIDSDEFDNSNTNNSLLRQSQTVINRIIGSANYDIGHTVSTGDGGVARLESPCTRSIKAMGVTGSRQPLGDPFDVDFVAHEMGHQFGATHTFNNFCSGNIEYETAVEPGSGSTIMGYAGVCAPSVQSNSDSFFHSVSIAQINGFINARGNCAENTQIEKEILRAEAGSNYDIPKGTPFRLTGTAIYEGTNNLTYSWEQANVETATQPPVSSSTQGPVFRVFEPTDSNVRYFPKFENVLSGQNSTWEVVPTVARVLSFNLLIRDNDLISGGQTSTDSMKINIQNVGPFVITAPNSNNEQWVANSTQNITWSVAGTDSNNINTTHVNILFSADNGLNFSTLKENTPNDGTESITVPDIISENCRILIEPVGNVYYAVSKKFKVSQDDTVSLTSFDLTDLNLYPNPTNQSFTINFKPRTTDNIAVTIHDLGGRLIFSQNYTNTGEFNQEINLASVQSGIYLVTVQEGNSKNIKRIIKK